MGVHWRQFKRVARPLCQSVKKTLGGRARLAIGQGESDRERERERRKFLEIAFPSLQVCSRHVQIGHCLPLWAPPSWPRLERGASESKVVARGGKSGEKSLWKLKAQRWWWRPNRRQLFGVTLGNGQTKEQTQTRHQKFVRPEGGGFCGPHTHTLRSLVGAIHLQANLQARQVFGRPIGRGHL